MRESSLPNFVITDDKPKEIKEETIDDEKSYEDISNDESVAEQKDAARVSVNLVDSFSEAHSRQS